MPGEYVRRRRFPRVARACVLLRDRGALARKVRQQWPAKNWKAGGAIALQGFFKRRAQARNVQRNARLMNASQEHGSNGDYGGGFACERNPRADGNQRRHNPHYCG